MKVKFNSSNNFILVRTYMITENIIHLLDDNLVWDLSGFVLYEDDEKTIIKDCSDFIYQWNVYTEYQKGVTLTNSKTEREGEPDPNEPSPVEDLDPLSNEELTSCVGDLMFEMSLMKMGLEVE